MTEYPISSYAIYVLNGTKATCIEFYEHSKCRGAMLFVPDNANLEDAKLDKGKIILNQRINAFHAVLDIVKHEKPIYLFYDDPKSAGIRSGRETIGDDRMWIT
jgi:hypothetical protein